VGSGFAARSTLNDNLVEDQTAGNPGAQTATGIANNGWTMQMVALKLASVVTKKSVAVPTAAAMVPAAVLPQNGVSALSCSPRAVSAGAPVTCELRVTASPGALQLALQSNSPQVKVPSVVTTRPNQSSLTFQAFVEPAAQQQSAIVTAILAGSRAQDTILIMPAAGPVLTVPDRQNAKLAEPIGFTVSAVDPDGLRVQLAMSGDPGGASFDPASGRFEWTPTASQAGKHTVTFTAVNSLAQIATAQTDIEVDAGTPVLTPSQQVSCSSSAIASLAGKWLAAPGVALSDPTGSAMELGGAKVKINGQYVPVLFSSATQVNFLCPALDAGTPLSLAVETASGVTEPLSATMVEASPAILGISFPGTADLAMVRNFLVPAHPAQPGDQILIRASGLGAAGTLLVKLGDIPAEAETVNAVAGSAGQYTIQARVPAGVAFGDAVPVQVQIASPGGRQFNSNIVAAAIEAVR